MVALGTVRVIVFLFVRFVQVYAQVKSGVDHATFLHVTGYFVVTFATPIAMDTRRNCRRNCCKMFTGKAKLEEGIHLAS